MDNEQFLYSQRALRQRFFEGPGALQWRPGRELVAQLLLYLDQPQTCWRLIVEWLRDTVDADRADGGWGGFIGANGRGRGYIVAAESLRRTMLLPSVQGIEFDASDPSLISAWRCENAAWIDDVSQARQISPAMRSTLGELGTNAKLAIPLRSGGRALGLLCADWHHRLPRELGHVADEVTELAREGLGPLLAVAWQTADAMAPEADDAADDAGAALGLTPAELLVARLAVRGLSYKEIAREIDRSQSTVDHHLRRIRDKLDVPSTSRLIHVLNGRL